MITHSKTRPWITALWISAAFVVIPPLLGLIGTWTGMFRTFERIETVGGASPEALAGEISLALSTTAAGVALAILGIVGVIISLVGLCRAKHSA